MTRSLVSDIPPPKPPEPPVLEDVNSIPDQAHDWGSDDDDEDGYWESGYHGGRICKVCGELSECQWCNRDALKAVDCLRQQAEERNFQREHAFKKATEAYEAQMDYYRAVVGRVRADDERNEQ